jgi:hypothetical protein
MRFYNTRLAALTPKRSVFMKNKLFLRFIVLFAFWFIFASCVTYKAVDVTNTQAAQINNVQFHEVQPGEKVKAMYIKRTGSFVNDLNKISRGSWYVNHKESLVSIEAVLKNGNSKKPMWRIEYVE